MPDGLFLGVLIGLVIGGAVAAWQMSRNARLAADRARLEAELTAALQSASDQRTMASQSQAQLREAFSALSSDALRENRQDFLRNADALLAPVRDTLNRVQDRLADVDKQREGSYRAVS